MTQLKPFAFVLMPFASDFDDIYKVGIKSIADELGIVAERVDEQIFSETMLERIYRQIDAADFIIADMSGRNPNVFYEVGYAHARGKLCTLLTQDADDIPFDLKHHRHLVYGRSIVDLKKMLRPELEWLKSELEARKTTAFTVTAKADGSLTKDDWFASGDLNLAITIKNNQDRRSPEIDSVYLYTSDGWSFKQAAEYCAAEPSKKRGYQKCHLLRSPVARLAPGAWTQISLSGEKRLWSKFGGDEPKEIYKVSGTILIEINTSEGSFFRESSLEVEFEDIPF
ncbi:hypothetical protein ABIB83_004612 [Bradyrhizobium sp. I1.8.5]|uniref:hypothetical protein n=1 Tax=unclassified Bradyrhizobium TaxID=2631580 RepID=UPI0033936532